jgi:hypothetical protein
MNKKTIMVLVCGLWAFQLFATGLLTCDSGDKENWKTQAELKTQMLEVEGWEKIRKIKVDGECYEVYGTNPDGRKVEAYYHPVTLEKLLVARWGKILYDKRKEEK